MSDPTQTRRSFLKWLGAAGAGTAALFAGFVPEAFAARGPTRTGPQLVVTTQEGASLKKLATQAVSTPDGAALVAHLKGLKFSPVGLPSAARYVLRDRPDLSGYITKVPFVDTMGEMALLVRAHTDSAVIRDRHSVALLKGPSDQPSGTDIIEILNGVPTLAEQGSLQGDNVTVTQTLTGLTRTAVLPPMETSAPSKSTEVAGPMAGGGGGWCPSGNLCPPVYSFLYGLGCAVTSFVTCLACGATGPGAFVCGAMCAIFWYLVCYLGLHFRSPEAFCIYVGMC